MSTPGADKNARLVELLTDLLGELTGGSVETSASAELLAETAKRDDEVQARLAALTARDHVIGLEATNSRLLADLRKARARNKELDARIAELEAQLEAVYASRTWKAGRAIVKPLGKLRR